MANANACPACESSGTFLKEEARNGQLYRLFRCVSCSSIFCPDHFAAVSPDYVERTAEDITPEVIWCQGGQKQDVFDQLFRMLQSRGHKVRSVLDIGCGTGGFLAHAKARGVAELYGFDAAEAQVRFASQVSPHVRHCVSVSDYVKILGRAPRWDVVTLWDVIEHIRSPQNLMADLRHYCDANTLVFLCTPNGISEFIKLHLRRAFSVAHSFVPWEHVMYYSPEGLRIMLEDNGFKVVCLTGAVCYKRPVGAFELIRRAAFATTRRTPIVPQLFVLAQRTT